MTPWKRPAVCLVPLQGGAGRAISKQALNSESIQARILSVLLGPGELWAALRGQGTGGELAALAVRAGELAGVSAAGSA